MKRFSLKEKWKACLESATDIPEIKGGTVPYAGGMIGFGTITSNPITYPDGLGSSANCTDIGTPTKNSTGKVGSYAWTYDGSSSSNQMGQDISYIGTNDFSINFWVKTTSTTRSNLFGVYDTDLNDIQLEFRATGQVRFNLTGAYDTTATINSGNWVMVTATRSGTALKVYVNGVVESFTDSGILNISTTYKPNIMSRNRGDLGGSTDLPLAGSMDEFTLWSRVLSQSDVNALYASGSGATPLASGISLSGLKAYYNFEQTSGNLINQAIP